jgi:hypothetical protein
VVLYEPRWSTATTTGPGRVARLHNGSSGTYLPVKKG